MALKIKLKRFTDSSGDPSTSDLEVGEVGINPVQKKIFVNKVSNFRVNCFFNNYIIIIFKIHILFSYL